MQALLGTSAHAAIQICVPDVSTPPIGRTSVPADHVAIAGQRHGDDLLGDLVLASPQFERTEVALKQILASSPNDP